MSGGWIGVDLDGTLALWGAGHNTDVWQIGAPIPPMVARVQQWLADGREVRIVTARVGQCGNANADGVVDDGDFAKRQRQLIEDWCISVFGVPLPVTASKDFQMLELWDDRCVQVMPNLGVTAVAAVMGGTL